VSVVLFIDRAWPLLSELVHDFHEYSKGTGVKVIILSEFKKTGFMGEVEVINIHSVPQSRSLRELQELYPFSIHRCLVTERAFYDYCSFRRSQCYSRLSESEIAEKITPYANALDYVIRERADIVIDWLQDSFVPSLAGPIAEYYKKPFRMFLPHYWWSNGALVFDRMDQTSSVIDNLYQYYYSRPDLCDITVLDSIFKEKKTLYVIKRSRMYSIKHRIVLFMNRLRSYEPISIRNWIIRRLSAKYSKFLITLLIRREANARSEPFLVYPLQTSPEASLLGTLPEVADQFNIIKNVSMNLPYGVKLYVKEHPFDYVGAGLDYSFYKRLGSLPNVRIIRGKASLNNLLDHPQFIALVSLNGTSIIEAAFKRRPVFIFGRSFYGAADCFFKPKSFEEFYQQLRSIMRGKYVFNERALYAMLMALDQSVVRSDVNLVVDNSTALLKELPKIWNAYIRSNEWVRKDPITHPELAQ
jgi:hypothetical protein